MIFIDIETTGLSTIGDYILELAVLAVDDENLRPIDDGYSSIISNDTYNSIDEDMDPFVLEMHKKSGLLKEIESATKSIEQVQNEALRYIAQHAAPETVPMVGSSVHFDRSFLQEEMPAFVGYFNHRNLDISSIAQFFQLVEFPGLSDAPNKVREHRAMPDIYESLEELNFYKDLIDKHVNQRYDTRIAFLIGGDTHIHYRLPSV